MIGEAASPEVVTGVCDMVKKYKEIGSVNEVRTMHLGPDDILLALSVDFIDNLPSEKVEATIFELEKEIKGQYPEIRRLFIEVQDRFHHYESAKAEKQRDKGEKHT